MALPLILFGVLLYTAEALRMNTLDHVSVREGGTVTIPCLYDNQYKLNSKLWCRGFYWAFCQITARENDTGKWTITDYPAHNIFTVKLNNATSSDSGSYWCAVEIQAKPDDRKHLYLTVQQAPGVSVKSSSVSGHEGDNVSVQCFYTSEYQYKIKKWCRIKDRSCYTETDTSQNPSVQISDDGRSFTVLMTGLRLSDSGWYFCSAGDLQAPVQLTVQKDNNKQKNTSENDISSDEAGPTSSRIFLLIWTAVPLLTLVLLIWRIIQKHNLPTQGQDVCSETESHVMYDTVVFKKGKNDEQNQVSISRPLDQEVIYSALKLH